MLSRKKKPLDTDLFRLPFSGIISWKEYVEYYPDLIHQMDGTCIENCLSFYYELNIVNKIYEFRDNDAELDISEILGMNLNVVVEGEKLEEQEERKTKSCNDIEKLLDKCIEISNSQSCNDIEKIDYKKIKEESKKAKRERRELKLLERNKIEDIE